MLGQIDMVKKFKLTREKEEIYNRASERVKEDAKYREKALSILEITDLCSKLKDLSKEQLESKPDFDGVSIKYEKLYWKEMKSIA